MEVFHQLTKITSVTDSFIVLSSGNFFFNPLTCAIYLCNSAFATTLWTNNKIETQRKVLEYLYENKSFYKKAFRQEDQNCLSIHIKQRMMPTIKARTEHIDEIKTFEFYTEFVADSIVYSIKKWLLFTDNVKGEEFFNQLKACMRYTATKMFNK
jgi:hypothetical protein